MDALSALKMISTPAAGGLSASSAQGIAGSLSKSIPAGEMQQLTGGFSPTSAGTLKIGSASSDTPLQAPGVSSGNGAGFENMLGNFVNDVSQKQADASGAVSGLLSGHNVSLHQAMISMEEANVSFQMMVEVRNRLLDGYQELMRMQV